jgi:hypothetical protein
MKMSELAQLIDLSETIRIKFVAKLDHTPIEMETFDSLRTVPFRYRVLEIVDNSFTCQADGCTLEVVLPFDFELASWKE